MNAVSLKNAGCIDRREFWSAKDAVDRDSLVERYGRVAMVEAVLSIRDRQQRMTRRMVVASLVLTGTAVIVAGLSGWL